MNTQEEIKSVLRSKKTSYFMGALLITIGIIFIFHIGEEFGYRKAVMMNKASGNYYQAFGPKDMRHNGPIGYLFDKGTSAHGVAGKVINITGSKILVADNDGIEKNVLVSTSTLIRKHRTDISSAELAVDDIIVVIGSPASDGSIAAKIIRVLPPPTTASSSAE